MASFASVKVPAANEIFRGEKFLPQLDMKIINAPLLPKTTDPLAVCVLNRYKLPPFMRLVRFVPETAR